MAGESPGKSEQRKSSGETTRGEHDPRLGVFRESSGKPSGKADAADAADAAEGGRKEVSAAPAEADAIAKADSGPAGRTAGGDARLKAAVAAWVAGTDEDEDESGEPDSSAKTSGAAARPKGAGTGDEPVNGSPSGKDDEAAAADRPVNGAPSGNGKAPASEDRATAVFGALRPKGAASADDADADADEAEAPKAAEAAKDEPSGNGKSEASSGAARPKADGKDSGSADSKAPASGDSKPAAAGDQATAVFRTVRPKDGEAGKPAAADGAVNGSPSGNGKAPASGNGKAPGSSDGKDKASASGDSKPAAAGDQATAVFRTVRPKDGDAAGSGGASGEGKAPASGEGKAPASNKDKPAAPADQATAVFGAIRPKADGADKPSSDDQPTALIKAPKVPEPKPEAGPKAGAAKAAPREDSDSERTSQFVPLKSDEATAAPAKKAAPAKPGTPAKPPVKATPPAPKASGTPAKPAIPVTVTPPKDPADPASSQQAGGPAAPLDLLAQLTNTPPPPETPVRTVLRRVKIWTPLVVLLAIIFCVVQAFRPLPEPKLVLTANKAFKFDGDKAQMTWPASGQAYVEVDGLGSLGEFGEEKPVPIASVTKVMTAYITLRDHPMKKGDKKGALMTVDAKAVSDYQKGKPEGESLVRVTENQQLSEYEALEALMLPSANNIAKLLARWDAGSEDAFVKKMNDTAKELGMVNTHFTDPSGFDATTKSTAKDLVKLGRKAMADPVFKEISGLTEYIDSNGEKQKNFNPIVPLYGTGIKTGTTTAAGGNLLFAAEKKIGGTTQLIIGAVLAQHKTPIIDSVVAATKDAIESAKKALEAKTVVKKGDVVGAVDDGLGGRTPVVATKDVTAVGWAGLSVDLALNDAGHKLPHTAKPGTEVGMLTVGSGPGQVRVPVALKKELAEPGFGAKLTRLG